MTLQSNQRIIIVGGAARSGTTLTRNIIGTHSQVIAMPTDWTIYSQAAKLQSITAISKPQSAEDMYRALTIIFEQTPLRKYELRGDDLKDLCELHPPSWDSIFLISVLGLQRKHPDKIILLKSPGIQLFAYGLEQLLAANNITAHYIFNVRDPFRTYLSHKYANNAVGWDKRKNSEIEPYGWAGNWFESTTAMLEMKYAYPERVMIARMEDLTSQSYEMAKQFCTFLDVPMEAEAMQNIAHHEVNTSFPDSNAGDKAQIKATKTDKELSATEKQILIELCSQRAKVFAYDIGNSPLATSATAKMFISANKTKDLIDILGFTLAQINARLLNIARRSI